MSTFLQVLIVLVIVLRTPFVHAQYDALAKQYYDDGQFDKAASLYKNLWEEDLSNSDYLNKLLDCYLQLEQFTDAEKLLIGSIKNQPNMIQYLVDLGHLYQIQNRQNEADKYYNDAMDAVKRSPQLANRVGEAYERYSMLDRAVEVYTTAMETNTRLNFHFQLARIYGEQGRIQEMFDSYLEVLLTNPAYLPNIQRYLTYFITEDSENPNNELLRKTVLRKIQQQTNPVWNQLLSWLFIQQGDLGSAFIQEKALYAQNEGASLQPIMDLAQLVKKNNDYELSLKILEFIKEQSSDTSTLVWAEEQEMALWIEKAAKSEYVVIDQKFQELFNLYGRNAATLSIQFQYARFLSFTLDKPQEGEELLRKMLEQRWNNYQESLIKMQLADVLVYEEKFNQALIYYTQVQKSLKNDQLGQDARYKVAQTSYYKGDFEWAEAQLKILKSSTSQLIANDALELKLLISDNRFEDSTLTALKLYAKADLMTYQAKDSLALALLDEILEQHKGQAIEDEALLKQALLFEKRGQYEAAKRNYLKIIEFYGTGILADDAHYKLAELYNYKLNSPELAKMEYERIIFDYPDSIYFVEARKKYRLLRGDLIN